VELLVLSTAVLLARRGRWAEAGALVAGALLVFVSVHVGKAIVDRPRPPDPLVAAGGSSYPSGHAAYSTAWPAAAIALARAGMVRIRSSIPLVVIALVLAAAIGLSRIVLRVHWWTDVIGGWGLGVACFSLCALLLVVISSVRQNEGAPA
jgi:undecaprenyl-diphosphatase